MILMALKAWGVARGVLAKIPTKVWLVLGALVALWLLAKAVVGWHENKLERVRDHADRAGYARAMDEVAAAQRKATDQAMRAKLVAEEAERVVNRAVEVNHAKRAAVVRADARAIGLRGPGAAQARCPASRADLPRPTGAAGQPDGAGGSVDAGLAGFAFIRWDELVARGESCDYDRSRLIAFQERERRLGTPGPDAR